MKYLVVPFLTIFLFGAAFASDYGVGVSTRSGNPSIYLPINISDKFRIEPVLAHYEYSATSSGTEYKSKRTDLMLGFFGRTISSESISTYYGGRIGYSSNENGYVTEFGVNETEEDGYIIEPIMGFEYHFINNLTLGGEVSFRYSKFDGKTTVISNEDANGNRDGEFKSNSTTNTTVSNVVLRYIF